MDEVTFKSDTVLSDVHLYTPNQRHLMVRLNGMGQPGKIQAAWSSLLPSLFHICLLGKDWVVYLSFLYPSPPF